MRACDNHGFCRMLVYIIHSNNIASNAYITIYKKEKNTCKTRETRGGKRRITTMGRVAATKVKVKVK